MNDRELLEMAARAAEIQIATWSNCQAGGFQTQESADSKFWNPLTDDGDALRLAVTLGIQVLPRSMDCVAVTDIKFKGDCVSVSLSAPRYDDHGAACSAMRLAIVRAAAEIGKSM